MNRTVVAVFDSRDSAEAARNELVGVGIPSDDIHLRGGTAADDNRTDFWRRTLGATDAEADRYGAYAEAERRGNAALIIEDVEDHEAASIETALAAHGVVDLQKLADDWRARGWLGYESNAPALSPGEINDERHRATRWCATGDDARRCVRVFAVVAADTGQRNLAPGSQAPGGRTPR